MIVTIDGPAGSGKSTVARLLAERLNLRFLDTGAMYRAVALAVLKASADENHHTAVAEVAKGVSISFDEDRLLLNAQDVTSEIRSPEVTAISSIVAANPEVRKRLVELQRDIGKLGNMVTEGRDQGTVVFPDAEHKFFAADSGNLRMRAFSRLSRLSWNSFANATNATKLASTRP